jgi:glycosyltransferase involved in cell wall biosynthesis
MHDVPPPTQAESGGDPPLDFVVFSVNSWDAWHEGGLRTRNARVFDSLRRFENGGQVLHVETFAKSRLPHVLSRRRRLVQHTGGTALPVGWPHALVRVDERTLALQIPRPLLYHLPAWTARLVTSVLRRCGLREPVLWVYDPAAARLFDHVPSRLRAVDADFLWLDHPDLVRRGRGVLERGYAVIRRAADLVVRVSERDTAVFAGVPSNVVVPNGYDQRLFTPGAGEEPADLRAIPHPRVAYVGTIQGRVDVPLLRHAARARPSIHWVILGPIWDEPSLGDLRRLFNVHVLGSRPHAAIPAYLGAVDAGIIPHRVDRLTESMDPLKLYEYLAMGLPVVSTPVAGLAPFRSWVRIADTPDAFVQAVETALATDDPALREERRAAVIPCSWSARLATIHDAIRAAVHAPDLPPLDLPARRRT